MPAAHSAHYLIKSSLKAPDLLEGQSNRAAIWIKKLTDYSCITAAMTNFLTYCYSLLTNYLVTAIPLLLIAVYY